MDVHQLGQMAGALVALCGGGWAVRRALSFLARSITFEVSGTLKYSAGCGAEPHGSSESSGRS